MGFSVANWSWSLSIATNRAYRNSTDVRENRQPKRSLTGSSRFCLQPRYRSVVNTDTWTKQELNLFQFAAIHTDPIERGASGGIILNNQ
jgi:hypothetical protein